MSTPERQQDADPVRVGYGANANPPDNVGASEIEARRQSELAGQQAAKKSSGTPKTVDSDLDCSCTAANDQTQTRRRRTSSRPKKTEGNCPAEARRAFAVHS